MQYAVIMAGGSGTRLWPLSRQSQPKQALKLTGDRTMFQQAVDRLLPAFAPERILVVTNAAIAEVLRPQTPDIPPANFVIEPAGRDSAPAAGLAAVHLLARDPDAVMVMLTADHFIADTETFRRALAAASSVAEEGAIATLGIAPHYPATGFGYIRCGEKVDARDGFDVFRVGAFMEKPDAETAARFLSEGTYVWNSGMFVWRAARLMAEFESQLPALSRPLREIGAVLDSAEPMAEIARIWESVPRISIDYGIMEHAKNVMVLPVSFGWTDVGSWNALLEILDSDADGNVVRGEALLVDTARSLVRSEGRLVATIGLQDIVIVDTPDVVLVCAADRAQDVREVVQRLAKRGMEQYL